MMERADDLDLSTDDTRRRREDPNPVRYFLEGIPLTPCRSCGNARPVIIVYMPFQKKATFCVKCLVCGNTAPRGQTPENAADVWNDSNNAKKGIIIR